VYYLAKLVPFLKYSINWFSRTSLNENEANRAIAIIQYFMIFMQKLQLYMHLSCVYADFYATFIFQYLTLFMCPPL